jgi:lipopolysaccharide export system permease protein
LKTLHNYITGQVMASLVLTVGVFAFVVLLLNVLHDVLPLLLGGHVPLSLVAKAIGLLMPFACVYALPMGLITATLLVFGRFSADQELTAVRASGVSLLVLITPILILSLLCCCISALFNMQIGPQARVAFLNLKYDLLHEGVNVILPEGQLVHLNSGGKHYQIYVAKNHNGELEDVNLYQMESETNWDMLVHAPHGQLGSREGSDPTVVQPVVRLTDARILHGKIITGFENFEFIPEPMTNQIDSIKISDMTFAQLWQELHTLQHSHLTPVNVTSPGGLANLQHLNLSVKTNASPEEIDALLQQAGKIRNQQISRVREAMHRQIAFSFACFGFTLVGIPLGIRVHRRETNIGIAMALGLVVVYYGFVMFGETLAARPEFYPHLILWLPNFIFQGVGAFLLWRANRGI